MKIKKIVVGSLGVNCYIVSDNKKQAFIIDPGDEAEVITEYLKKDKIDAKFIINTHAHIDHIQADYSLGLPVYIHKNDALALKDPSKNYSSLYLGPFLPCNPDKILEDGDKIEIGELNLEILHTPGHSAGSISIKLDKVVFTGDTLFRNSIGRTDLPDSSYQAIISSIKNKLLCLSDDTIVYPGHGAETTIGEERKNF